MPNQPTLFNFCTFFVLLFLMVSCKKEQPKSRGAQLYDTYCASCHIPPKIDELPKNVWKESVLPAMMERMEVEGLDQDFNLSYNGLRPKITLQEWAQLETYIVTNAPEYLESIQVPQADTLRQFKSKSYALDKQNGGMVTYLEFKDKQNTIFYGDLAGNLGEFDFTTEQSTLIYKGKSPVTWYNKKDSVAIITEIGIIRPSELEEGKLMLKMGEDTLSIQNGLHRPVHTLMNDLNDNGKNELVISEFGNQSGRLSLLFENELGGYSKKMLLNLPGAIKTVVRDMNNDGKKDIVALMTQSTESITVFYQTDNLTFEARNILQFSPVLGTSWFELVDYNGDGLEDIITVHGDNADISYVHKPYHGMRIYLNNGDNTYSEAFFYPKTGFYVKGWAKNVETVLENARVVLAPLQFGAGIKGKLLDAMQAETPSVTTTIGAEGMHGEQPWNGTITDNWNDFAQAAVEFHQDQGLWENAKKHGIELLKTFYDKTTLQNQLLERVKQLNKSLEAHRQQNFIGKLLQHQTMASSKYMAKWIEEKNRG
jgi:hypothetical protein